MAEQNPSRLWGVLEQYPRFNDDYSVMRYLDLQGHEQQEKLAEGLDYLAGHATPAFKEMGLADIGTTLIISDQEAPNIAHTLHQYKMQPNTPYRRVLGYLNWPTPFDRNTAAPVRKILDTFVEQNPDIPFGYFEGSEKVPACMGAIRGLPGDMLQVFLDDHGLMNSHDADLRALSPDFNATLLTNYHERLLSVAVPDLVHEEVPGHPNANAVLRWMNDTEAKLLQGIYYDLGLTYSAMDYRTAGGYGPEYIAETITLANTIASTQGVQLPDHGWVPGAKIVTSSRRLLPKLLDGVPVNQMWDGPGDFKAHEHYRTLSQDDLVRTPDISQEARDERLREYGKEILDKLAIKYEFIDDGTATREDLIDTLEAMRNRLSGPDDMFDYDNWQYTN